MLPITLLGIAIGLSADAFAVSISNALSVSNFNRKQSIYQALYFGVFQMLMPFIGWTLGNGVHSYIEAIDHWIAFILLSIIGGNMIRSSFSAKDTPYKTTLSHKTLLLQAIATSIDALAVGIGFGILHTPILQACIVIGCTTFVISLIGSKIGSFFGSVLEEKAELFGGIILILIGLQILLEHTLLH